MGKVSVRCRNVSLEAALRQVLGKNFTFRIVDNTVIIRPEKMKPDPVKQQVVKGVVVDAQGIASAGCDCFIERYNFGNVNRYGWKLYFSFPHTAGSVFTVFSFIGMKTAEVTFSGQANLKIVLEEETTQMDEVVVTGIFGA